MGIVKTASRRKPVLASAGYVALLAIFYFIARFFDLKPLHDHPLSTFLSFALIFAPYWFLGFGAAEALRSVLAGATAKIVLAAFVAVPYAVLAFPRGEFRWGVAVAFAAFAVATAALLHASPKVGNWADFLVLAALGAIVDFGLLSTRWPFGGGSSIWPPGLGGFPKLLMMDLALYLFLVVKPVDGVGYGLVPNFSDVKIGLREFVFYAPIVIPLGLWLGFLRFHPALPKPFIVPAAWIFTFVFVAMPEEFFFRGLLQNLLERRLGRHKALIVAAIIFGFSHFNKRAVFNWKYVLLAAIAGIFYGRAWRARRRLFASSITHTSVDTVWSLWFR